MSKVHVNFLRGTREAGTSDIQNIEPKEKQFSAVLTGASPGDSATVEIRMAPDNDKDRSILVATLSVTAEEPGDVTEIIESLVPGHYAEVTEITGGAVWVFGDA